MVAVCLRNLKDTPFFNTALNTVRRKFLPGYLNENQLPSRSPTDLSVQCLGRLDVLVPKDPSHVIPMFDLREMLYLLFTCGRPEQAQRLAEQMMSTGQQSYTDGKLVMSAYLFPIATDRIAQGS